MRSTFDRLRQALLFEIIGLCLAAPLGAWALGHSLTEIGGLALIASVVATIWNYVYNLAFDRALLRLTGSTRKRPAIRVLHALLFETALVLALLPVAAWWLETTLWRAFVADAGLSAFYLVYAFVFTWCYDRAFPPPPLPAAAR
jgi:uncharacterized membrane protein